MGEFNSDEHYIYYYVQESLIRNGVAIIVNKRVQNAVFGWNLKNARMISVCFQGKPFNITIIQVYALTSNAEKLKLNISMKTYKTFWTNTKKICPFHYRGLEGKSRKSGKFGLGVQNEAGKRLIVFCQEYALVIANTLFQQHKRQLYTWTSPDGQYQNQIDYILFSWRWRSSIQSAKTRPGACKIQT